MNLIKCANYWLYSRSSSLFTLNITDIEGKAVRLGKFMDVLSNSQCKTLLWHNCLSQIRCQFGYRPIGLNQNMQHSPFFVIGIVWGHKSRIYRASSFLHRSLSEGSDCFWQSYQPHYKMPISDTVQNFV